MHRRDFLKHSAVTTGLLAFPTIVTRRVFGQNAPSNLINIGQIGCGRIARTHDIPETIRHHDLCRFTAVADPDIKRAQACKKLIEDHYNKANLPAPDVKVYQDYREMLQDKSIDAVVISTPDHWHSQPVIEAALAGKDMYLQKPAALTIVEGRQMSDAVHRTGAVFQVGSQQRGLRPWPQFHRACELVRNGRIGQVKRITVGLPGDPGGEFWPEMPVPENLNYDLWLGSTPDIYYTENRVHPQNSTTARPGWLRVEQFGAGMITGWGAHHIDTAHWGMGTEYTGPIEVEAEADFPKSGLWDVHGEFHMQAKYANGVIMDVNNTSPNGVRFEGDEGWLFVTRGSVQVTESDPVPRSASKALDASDPKILQSEIKPGEIHLYRAAEQHHDWLNCIKTRQEPVAPVEVAHRSCSACLLGHIAMKLPGRLYWDPAHERFVNNAEANQRLARTQRYPYGTNYIKM